MNDLPKTPTPPGRPPGDMGIAWEALPSLKYLLSRQEAGAPTSPVWSDTQPSQLDDATPSEDFQESLPGLTVREVTEPDVFKAFFEVPKKP